MLRLPALPWLYAILALLWMGLIYYLSSQEERELFTWVPVWLQHRLSPGHIALFGVLAGWYWLALWAGKIHHRVLWTILLTSTAGVLDEWHQLYVPTRTPDLKDFVYDLLGAVVAIALVRWLERKGWLKMGLA